MCTQGRETLERIYFLCAQALQTERNFPVNTFLFLPPFRCQERRSKAKPKTSHNKLFKNQHSNKDYATEVTLITGPTKQTKHFSINLLQNIALLCLT